jgi:hypothetical protein
LQSGTNAANGTYRFAFSLYDTNPGGSVIGTSVSGLILRRIPHVTCLCGK